MANETILVVDDEQFNRDMLSRRLKREGYDAFTASGGREAITMVKALGRIDMILLDIMMPEMDGIETARILRRLDDYETPPRRPASAAARSTSTRTPCSPSTT